MDFRRTDSAGAREPAINLPMPIVASILVLLAIQAVRSFVSDETDVELLLTFAFIPAQWSVAFGFAGPDQVVGAAVAGAGSAEQGSPSERSPNTWCGRPQRVRGPGSPTACCMARGCMSG